MEVLSPSALAASLPSPRGVHLRPSPVPCAPRFVALHSYSAHGPDELDLQKGEGIRVLGKYQDGWLKGISLVTGRVGIFPNNYVIPIFRCVPSTPRQQGVGSSRPGPLWVELLKDSMLFQSVGQETAFVLVPS